MVDKIADGVVVTLAYTLTAEGMEIERATADDPLDYLHGAENIVPGLETALTGKTVGDKLAVTLKPEDAYGDYDEEEVEAISWEDIPEGENIEPGMVLVLEPVIWDEGAAGYRSEDIYAVTDDGWMALSDYPFDPYLDR